MAVEKITLYEVQEWDGGEQHHGTGYAFRDKALATKAAGIYGAVQEHEFCICETIEDLADGKEAKKRQKALSKLTAEERQILGLE